MAKRKKKKVVKGKKKIGLNPKHPVGKALLDRKKKMKQALKGAK